MCEKNGFDEKRIRSGAEKLSKARDVKPQSRLDSFFKVLPSTPNAGTKRKSEEMNGSKNGSNKKAKSGGGKKGFLQTLKYV